METASFGAIVSWVDRPPRGGVLNGLRVGIKDVIAVQGVPRRSGAPGIVDASPQPRDATCVARLVADGAQIVATTTTHQLSYGVTTPGVQNPAAPGRIAGGSSGGAAAALAAGLIDGALGTDTAGSVRIPAACCGVAALKTTEGLVPRDGVQPLAPSFDTVGPMARDVATLTALLRSITGSEIVPTLPSRLRVGVVREARESPLDDVIRDAWTAVLQLLRRQGARVVDVSIPLWDEQHRAAGRILAAEALKAHGETLRVHAKGLAPDVRAALESATTLSQEKVLDARRTAAMVRDRIAGVFRDVDVLVLPVLPCRVPLVGADTVTIGDRPEPVASALTRLVDFANVAGIPAGAVPLRGSDVGGVPFSVQVAGAWTAEPTVLGVMALLQGLSL